MYRLFSEPDYKAGAIVPNGWNNAVRALYTEMNKLAVRYKDTSQWLPNTHPLVKILKADRTPLYKNFDSTIYSAREQWLKEASNYGISTVRERSQQSTGSSFYPQNITEYLVMDDSIPIGDDVAKNWRQAEPIRVLDHPYFDLNLSVPNGRYTGMPTLGTSAYIAINIPMLVLQYRLWQKYEADEDGFDRERADIFLMRYPMFNIMNSHMDVVLRNRFVEIYNDRELPKFKSGGTSGIAVNDTSNFVDRGLRECATRIKSGRYTFSAINQQIPQLSRGNLAGTLILPQMTYTRTCRWVYDMSRLSWIEFLISHNNVRPNESNRDEITQIRRRLKAMQTDREFYSIQGGATNTAYANLSSLLG